MMELLNFVKWQWSRFDDDDKIFLAGIAAIVVFVSSAIIFNMGFLFTAATVITFIASVLIGTASTRFIRVQWKKYKKQIDGERQAVVDKLAGRPYSVDGRYR